jgi:hypothetical protein
MELRQGIAADADAAAAGQGPRPMLFEPTTQPTIDVSLCDFCGVRPSPSLCKLLKNQFTPRCHGRGRGFESRPRHSFPSR